MAQLTLNTPCVSTSITEFPLKLPPAAYLRTETLCVFVETLLPKYGPGGSLIPNKCRC